VSFFRQKFCQIISVYTISLLHSIKEKYSQEEKKKEREVGRKEFL
jgi:hypothetical protein